MSKLTLVLIDLAAVFALAFGLYFPRYRRRDIVVAIVGLNIGVLAVVTAFQAAEVSAGLGFGLFGVLSIIRLRSAELDQEEVAYYFSALAMGLLGGIAVDPDWLAPVMMAVILTALLVCDHPRLFPAHRRQIVTVDAAYTDERSLTLRLEELMGGQVLGLKIRKVDLVKGTTTVDVRFRLDSSMTPLPPNSGRLPTPPSPGQAED
jgi:hypothetical protein